MTCKETTYIDKNLVYLFEEKNVCWKKLNTPCQILECKNAYILPCSGGSMHPYKGGIVDENLNLVEASKILPNRLIETYDFNSNLAIKDDREVIYIGCFWRHWGHFITDEISRLYALLKDKYSNLPIAYIAKDDLSDNYLELFELLGIDTKRLIRIEKPTQFKTVYVPEVSFSFCNYYTEEFINIFQKLQENTQINETCPKKIFLSRGQFKKAENRDLGEIKEIEKFFENNDYKLIYPEKLSLKEQLEYYKSADEIVTTSGSISHNVLFAKPNTKIIILNRSCIFNAMQKTLNTIAKVNATNIDAQLSFSSQHIGRGPFYYHFSEQLIQWAKENNLEYEIPKNNNYLKKYLTAYFEELKKSTKELYTPVIFGRKKSFFNIHLKKVRSNFSTKILMNIFNVCKIPLFLFLYTKIILKKILFFKKP